MTRRPPLRQAAAGIIIASLAVLVLAADQFAKYLALENLPYQEPVEVLGDFLSFYLTRNPGAAFSLGEEVTWIFTIALAAVAGVIAWLAATRVRSRLWAVALGLLLGGVLGNLTDRLFRNPGFAVGHVVDFINTPWMWFFPGMSPAIYNIADIFIVCDMIAIALLVLVGVHMDGSRDRGRNDEEETETLLGADGDQFAPGGAVAGFGSEFPVADADAGIPADERGLPPLTESEQLEVEAEAEREAEEYEAEPEHRRPGRDAEI
ncbi:signal peptidase II [Microbacterium sp. QXD-8]|uniref:Lipoprotein signal peptidase n=1 Tax=Microbacterium psychrotolerans TaxID=3068321 RepID=A0ABU0Z0C7_9MICO|nr:signal peptidase II [Microbacterium sp. QXD-8]MDQ7878037.1 signal peptidase II [Microbacterium sp. QXD-8]